MLTIKQKSKFWAWNVRGWFWRCMPCFDSRPEYSLFGHHWYMKQPRHNIVCIKCKREKPKQLSVVGEKAKGNEG